MARLWRALALFVLTTACLITPAWAQGMIPAAEPATSVPQASESAPRDAPELGQDVVVNVPSGYNSYDGGWVQFAYHPSVRERVQPLIAAADAVRAQLRETLGVPVLNDVRVHVARTPREMATLAPAGAPFPEYAAGVAYSSAGLILLTIQPLYPSSKHDLAEIFRHELAHVALHDAVFGAAPSVRPSGGLRGGSAEQPGANGVAAQAASAKPRSIPRWFNEGFAVFASGESSLDRLQTLWTATLADNLIPLSQLEQRFPSDDVTASVAYAEAADVVRFLMRSEEQHRFRQLIERMNKGQAFDDALTNAYGTDLYTLEHQWREDVARRYTFWPVLFSGTMVWVGAIGLFVWGWRRRQRRTQRTLARWAKEEAAEDEHRRRISEQQARVHIVLSRPSHPVAMPGPQLRPPVIDPEVPKVEHDGQWHTLH